MKQSKRNIQNGGVTRDWSLSDAVYLNPETDADQLSLLGL